MAQESNDEALKNTLSLNQDEALAPSGFVLKLFQMVEGAPDEVVCWLPSGDAFKISDLNRLENETLPIFFRHRRFQSLVRQLNFYNFRKINRERTFWVYKHPLFHRNKPDVLHLLRRRTCPGVDGRKTRPELDMNGVEADTVNKKRTADDEESQNSDESSLQNSTLSQKRKTRSAAEPSKKMRIGNKATQDDDDESYRETNITTSPSIMGTSFRGRNIEQKSKVFTITPSKEPDEGMDYDVPQATSSSVSGSDDENEEITEKKSRMERLERSQLVNKVCRQLEAYARRAAANGNNGKGGRRRGGLVTPPHESDTMKYHALTYDDEMEVYDTEKGTYMDMSSYNDMRSCSPEVDTEENGKPFKLKKSLSLISMDTTSHVIENFLIPPVQDIKTIMDITRKVTDWATVNMNGIHSSREQLYPSIVQFCMSTAPQDPEFLTKALDLIRQCESLESEFRSYKIALCPNFSGKDLFMLKQCPDAKCHVNDVMRVFKVFILNFFGDFVKDITSRLDTHLTPAESSCLVNCSKTWFAGVMASP